MAESESDIDDPYAGARQRKLQKVQKDEAGEKPLTGAAYWEHVEKNGKFLPLNVNNSLEPVPHKPRPKQFGRRIGKRNK